MSNFISLSDGTIINLGAVAYITAEAGGPTFTKPKPITLVFPAAIPMEEGTYTTLDLSFNGSVAEELLSALEKRDIDVSALRKKRNQVLKGAIQVDVLADSTRSKRCGRKTIGAG